MEETKIDNNDMPGYDTVDLGSNVGYSLLMQFFFSGAGDCVLDDGLVRDEEERGGRGEIRKGRATIGGAEVRQNIR